MSNGTQANEESERTPDSTPQGQVPEPYSAPPEQPATEEHLEKVEREMNAFERSTLRWTKATFFILAVTCLFIGFQWFEMRSGSQDTHDLAVAAGKQAEALKAQAANTKIIAESAKVQAAAAGTQATDTHELAVQAKNQADRTKEVASQSLAQARSTNDLAIQAAKSAEIAQQQLRLAQIQFETSQRPWIVVKSLSALFFKWQPYMGGLAFNLQPKITYTNVGTFPATGIHVAQSMFFANQTIGSDFLSDVKQRQRDLCEGTAQSGAQDNDAYVQTLYPGRDGIYSPGLGLNPPNREQVRERDRIITPVLIGCIFYRYLSSPTVHYTGFIFVIERKPKSEEGSGQGSYTLTYGQEVAVGDVVFADGYNGNASYN